MLAKISGLSFTLLILIGCHSQLLSQHSTRITKQLPLTISLGSSDRWEAITDESSSNVPTCSDDMVEIDGEYCPIVKQTCLHWRDNAEGQRCEEWKNPVECISTRIHKHYCIDRYEYPNKKGTVPQDWVSWNDMKKLCSSEGKRLCTRSEWTFAAEGPYMHPYPYGDGFHRDNTICNFDNKVISIGITGDDVLKVSNPNSEVARALRSLLVPSGSLERCASEWGVFDMAGNIDESVINETGKPYNSGLMGGHVFGVRNASRPMTEAHNQEFYWYETGGRCCKDSNE